MTIEIKKCGPKSYYDEFLYVAFRFRDFKRRPKRKAYRITKFLLLVMSIVLISLLLSIKIYLYFNEILYIALITILSFILLFSIIYFVRVKKSINYFLNNHDTKKIDFNKDGIQYNDNYKSIFLNWNNVSYIIINKYSICFLSKENNILISIFNNYCEDVIKGLKKYNKENLLIDNTSLYKN